MPATKGDPVLSARASWRTDYLDGVAHADDWVAGDSHHPVVTLATNHGLSLSGQQMAMGTPSTLTAATTNAVTTTTHTHAITGFAVPGDLHPAVTLGANPGLSLSTQELVLGTPSTLTVSTTNAVSGANHTHAITSDSNPGATAKILATDASGYVVVQVITANRAVTAAIGTDALLTNTGAASNGFGAYSLYANTGAASNGFGTQALYNNTGASSNGFGNFAMRDNKGVGGNGFGDSALRFNEGVNCNGFGLEALYGNTGANCQGFGAYVLYVNTGASNNAFGYAALYENTTGAGNVAFGHNAGRGYTDNAYSVFLGYDARTASGTLTNCIVIGANARGTKSNQVYLGHTDIVETYLQGKVGVQITPTAYLTLPAGSATASTAPLKLTSGTLLTTAEAGAVEFLTDDLFFTITTGAARKGIVLDDGTRLTATRVPFATTNGRLVDDADLTFSTGTLSATKVAASGGVTTQAVDFTASTPDALAGDVNNWDLGNNTFIRASGGAADRIVTGIVARASGHLLIFQNIGTTNKITFANESASSTAGNRLINANAGSTEITPNHCIMYIYDATTARWREITHL